MSRVQGLAVAQVGAAIQRCEQGRLIGGNQVDNLEFKCLPGRGGDRLADDLLRPVAVAAALVGDAAGVGHRVVDHLFHHRLVLRTIARTADTDRDRVRSTDVGARGHRGEIRSERDQGAGRCGPGAGGRDIDDHRQAGAEDLLDDGAHCAVKSAGRVKFDHEGPRVAGVGGVQFGSDEVGDHRVDHPGHPHRMHLCCGAVGAVQHPRAGQ